jgi:hypothetical protein
MQSENEFLIDKLQFEGSFLFLLKVIDLAVCMVYLTMWVDSIHFKSTFLEFSSPHTYCGKGFLATCLVGSNINGQY